MTSYPSAIYAPRVKENYPGVVYHANQKYIGYAEDVVYLDGEITAIENELGLTPKGAFVSVKKFLEWLNTVRIFLWTALDTFTPSNGTPPIYFGACLLMPSTTLDDYRGIQANYASIFSFDCAENPVLAFTLTKNSATTYHAYFGMGDYYEEAPNEFCGFKIVDDVIYAMTYSADSSTETTTEITGVSGADKHDYRIEKTGSTSAKFYVDGVLKATITTTMSSSGNYSPFTAEVINKNEGDLVAFYIGPVSFNPDFSNT